MTGAGNIVQLAVVAAAALAFVTLLLVIQAQANGHTRREVVSTCVVLWLAVGTVLGAGWILDTLTGGGLFDLQTAGGTRFTWRPLHGSQAVTVVALLAAMVALFVVAVVSVRRLLAAPHGLTISAAPGDEGDDD